MPRYDFRTPRLYVDAPLGTGATVALDAAQANYLGNVLRLKAGDAVLVFNGRDGEWRAALASEASGQRGHSRMRAHSASEDARNRAGDTRPEPGSSARAALASAGKRRLALAVGARTRPQTQAPDLHYLFAPLKHARLDYLTQKAVEMGASRLQPVLTRHGQAARVNLARMRANAIEAAEQCGILTLPEIGEPLAFARMIAARDPARLLVFCDEDAEVKDPVAALAAARPAGAPMPLAVLVGPEGGFAAEERAALMALPNTVRLALGPRILRADTAAVAALALVGAVLGDWR